jgi:pimeloyl-ACP methyl ester carboxylesterase
VAALAAVGFNPQSRPLWPYHWEIYWGLTQKIYRLEMDPEYTAYTCSDTSGTAPSCVSPAAEQVPPTDPDASYSYSSRLSANAALAGRMQSVAETGNIQHPLITLHGDQDSLLPIKTDSDLYSQMVQLAGRGSQYRYYVVAGGNHVDPQFDDHFGVDSYGNDVLRPMLPCVWSALSALVPWVESDAAPPPSHTVPRPAGASAGDLANSCPLA